MTKTHSFQLRAYGIDNNNMYLLPVVFEHFGLFLCLWFALSAIHTLIGRETVTVEV